MKVIHIALGSASVPPKGYDSTAKDIFYLTKHLSQSGAEVGVIDIKAAPSLRRGARVKFHEVWDLPIADRGFYRMVDIRFPLHLLRLSIFALLAPIALRKLVKEEDIDIVHTHGQFAAAAILLARKLFGWKIPVFHSSHNHEIVMHPTRINRFKHLPENIAIHKADHVFVETATARKQLTSAFNVDPARVTISPEGLDLEEIAEFIQHNPIKHEENKDKIVLYPAVIIPRKNQLGLVKAIPKVIQSCPKTKFVFTGPVWDGSYFKAIQRFVADNGLTEQVEFTGELPRIPDLFQRYRDADIFAFPTFREMQGVALLEAMAFGLPCTASRIGPIVDVVGSDDSCALLVDPYNTDELADAIIKLLQDESLSHKLSARGKELVSRFDWGLIAKKMLETYERIGVKFADQRKKRGR